MKLHLLIVALVCMGLYGCGAKQNYIVPGADADGTATLMVTNATGTVVIGDGGQSVRLTDRNSRPEPVSLSEAEKQNLFGAALAVQPLAPVSFTLTFEFGNDALTQASRDLLPRILATIKERDSYDITVIGHTDLVGDAAYNYTLGMARAVNIREILIAQGVAADSVRALSYGEGDPLVESEKNVPEERNRRVEVVIR